MMREPEDLLEVVSRLKVLSAGEFGCMNTDAAVFTAAFFIG